MEFSLADALPLLRSTPDLLKGWLLELPDVWIRANEGAETWSPYDIVGHLIHGERTDWMPRVELLLKHGESRSFTPFDRFAQFQDSKGKSLSQLIDTFAAHGERIWSAWSRSGSRRTTCSAEGSIRSSER